ncbi:MAG: DoxX family protein [Bacteroidia bacterium]|nr:DoxX family protein [Bacteroidia bacterium]MDW8235556.1 DoxX family protein [Bacteroidia bacterium]
MRAKRDFFLTFSRLFVGILFTVSGLIKVNDVRGFAYKLDEYFEVFFKHTGIPFHEIFGPWSVGIAGFIAVFETSLAIFLLLGYWRRFTAWSLLLMIIFFTFLTGYSAVTKAVSDCGCFGDVIKFTPWQSFGKDVVLSTFIGYIFLKREEIFSWLQAPLVRHIAAWGAVALIAGLTIYFYLYLPALDFLPYFVGQNLKKALEPNAQGVPMITDYVPARYSPCQVDELSGEAIVLIAQRLESLSPVEIQRWKEFLLALPKEVKVVGMTASPEEVRTQWVKEQGLSVCFAPQDQTVLKAMLRSSAGAIYLSEGMIRAKWCWRRLPRQWPASS